MFYSADFAPKFTRGMWAMIGVSIALAWWTLAIHLLQNREKRKQALPNDSEVASVITED